MNGINQSASIILFYSLIYYINFFWTNSRLFGYNIWIISSSDTEFWWSYKKISFLNSLRTQHDKLSQGIWTRCFGYLVCYVGLQFNTQNFTENVSAY